MGKTVISATDGCDENPIPIDEISVELITLNN